MPTFEDLFLPYNYTGIPAGTTIVLPLTQAGGLYNITWSVLSSQQDAINKQGQYIINLHQVCCKSPSSPEFGVRQILGRSMTV